MYFQNTVHAMLKECSQHCELIDINSEYHLEQSFGASSLLRSNVELFTIFALLLPQGKT